MATNGVIIAPVDDWVDLTNGVSQWMLAEVMESSPVGCPGAYVRFQGTKPETSDVMGHVLRRGAGNLELGAQMDMLGGRAWARSMDAVYPAHLYVTSIDAP